jgi:pyrroloquinoline-quinone synthase
MSTTNVEAYANATLKKVNIFDSKYFSSLRDGSMSLEDFRLSQERFFYAVLFFSRPMAVLVARIPDGRDRLDILHNVLEEHGEMSEAEFHSSTFQKFLQSIGSVADFENGVVSPQVRAFNSVLTSSCTLDELEVGVACMGIIELAFSEISAIIGKAVVDRGWVRNADLVHYKLHAEIDTKHAADFFRIVERLWENKERQYFIKQGLELGAYIFDRLYKDLI